MKIIKTLPGDSNFHLIENLRKSIYTDEVLSKTSFSYNEDLLRGVYVLLERNKPLSSVALYKNAALNYNGYECGTLGNYESLNDSYASKKLLDHAVLQAKVEGVTFLIGPMNGSTWDNYLFNDNGDKDPFIFEPHNPIYYKNHFQDVGFLPISEYVSNIDENMNYDNPFIREREKQLTDMGVTIRSINMDDYETELKKIFQFIMNTFKSTFLFTPIKWEEFKERYEKMVGFIDPGYVMLAEYKKEVVGFVLNVKDHISKNFNTIIIKMLASNASLKFRGLGQILVKKTSEKALEDNYKSVIHALMDTKNAVVNLSEKNYGHVFKKYKLYGMPIYRMDF